MASKTPDDRRAIPVTRSGLIDLYDYARTTPPPRVGRPINDDLSDWRVIDDWPDEVPVTPEEVDVFEAWFGDILEELFGPKPTDRA